VTNPKSFSFTFWGTGFDIRWQSAAGRVTTASMTLNGVSLNSTYPNASGISCSVAGTGISYGGQAGTFTLNQVTGAPPAFDMADAAAQNGCSLRMNGFPLGMYTLVISDATASTLLVNAIDVITPIHSIGDNAPGQYQNSLTVGNKGIGDLRGLPESAQEEIPNWAIAIGQASSPTTTSTGYVPVPDMQVVIRTTGKPLDITATVAMSHATASGDMNIAIFVDGLQVAGSEMAAEAEVVTIAENHIVTTGATVPVQAGVHVIQVMAQTNTGTLTFPGTQRFLKVKEM
jgi:hypothetical protein